MVLINLENVTKKFGSNDTEVFAIRNIDLKINKGELIAIVGPSGSGKSTLLNIIGTLTMPTAGKYSLEDKKIEELSNEQLAKLRNKYFGFVVQHFALINDYSVYENVEIPLEYGKVKKTMRRAAVNQVLLRLNIQDKINNKPTQLSGGQCQRVAIARAIVNDPDIILADEPTGALDKQTGQQVIDIFKQLNREGKTVIIVTHDFNIASQCRRTITMEDGRISNDTKKNQLQGA